MNTRESGGPAIPGEVGADSPGGEQRRWLRALAAFVDAHLPGASGFHDEDAISDYENVNPRVRHALDMALVAAFERIGRICRSDITRNED